MKKAVILPLLFFLLLTAGEASQHVSIKGLRHSSYSTYTRVVVDLNGPVQFTQNRLSKPDRIFFDLKECTLSTSLDKTIHINNGTIKRVRFAQFKKDTVRVVLDIDRLKKFTAFELGDPNRLVIDIYPVTEAKYGGSEQKSIKTLPPLPEKRRKVIVIDPGHGGKDPGAVGPGGLKEKDITLAVGKKLGKILKAKYKADIIYTRTRDVFVPLNDRTEIANSRKADLFLSIHTNASTKRKARGIETYFLNWTNNGEALRVAARENKVTIAKMRKIQDGLQMILQDLARNTKKEESMRLAYSVQNSIVGTLKKNYSRVEDLGVKYALFYVLVGAEMPSALIEISFISNREEEKRLARTAYRNKIAEAIARGVGTYMTESTLIVDNGGHGRVTARSHVIEPSI